MNALSCTSAISICWPSMVNQWFPAVFGSLCSGLRKPFTESVKQEKRTNETKDVL